MLLLTMRALHFALLAQYREWLLVVRNNKWSAWCEPHIRLLNVELFAATPASLALPNSDRKGFHRHDGARHDWCAMPAASHLAGAMLGPEDVDHLRSFVAILQ